jgi:FMN phosphatase YigB (HAD superfamily)
MPTECVVLDLDGTLTDLSRGAPAFSAELQRLFAERLGVDLATAWPEEERRVRELAPELAWVVDGLSVGPADADPYTLATSTARRVCDRLGVLQDEVERDDAVSTAFRSAYRKAPEAFRPEAKPVVEALLARGLAVRVVTNAASEVATRRLADLLPEGHARFQVRGDAGKFVVAPASAADARFERVRSELRVPGLTRPILPRRGRYFDALAAIWAETGARPETTLVCGDIFELDLALPAELGAHVHLVRRPRTHRYEMDAVAALGNRGAVSDGLTALLGRI